MLVKPRFYLISKGSAFIKPFSTEDTLVAQLAENMALANGFNADTAKQISEAAALHDCGKSRMPRHILYKSGKLLPYEYEIMKTHTVCGATILSNLSGGFGIMAREICLLHHEKWDGSGYWKKQAEEQPIYCQITGICDVYVALTSKRPYKKPWPPKDALDYISKQSGKQFSPFVVKSFLSLFASRETGGSCSWNKAVISA